MCEHLHTAQGSFHSKESSGPVLKLKLDHAVLSGQSPPQLFFIFPVLQMAQGSVSVRLPLSSDLISRHYHSKKSQALLPLDTHLLLLPLLGSFFAQAATAVVLTAPPAPSLPFQCALNHTDSGGLL